MIKHLIAAGLALAAFAPAAYGQDKIAPTAPAASSAEDIRKADAQAAEEWYYSVGIQNYVFTLPLTMLERERKIRLSPAALEKAKKFAPAAPINEIGHMKTLATADDIMPYTRPTTTPSTAARCSSSRTGPSSSPRPTFPIATGPSKSRTPIPTTSSTSARERPAEKAGITPLWSSENLAEAPQRECKQRRANDKKGEELRPDDVDAGARNRIACASITKWMSGAASMMF